MAIIYITGFAPHSYAQGRHDSLTRENNPLYASASGGGGALYSTASSTGAGEDVSDGLYDLASNKKKGPSAKTKASKKNKGDTKNKTRKAKGTAPVSPHVSPLLHGAFIPPCAQRCALS